MNLLIVDDQNFELDAVSAIVSNMSVIQNIYCASSARAAKNILLERTIHILLCDIEMPTENGLELLEWVRENGIDLECIFLTAYPDFSYAKKAIALGCMDYILKPISPQKLEELLRKAGEKQQKKQTHTMEHLYSSLWFKHQPHLIEGFWTKLLSGRIDPSPEILKKEMEELNFPGMENMRVLPILISISGWERNKNIKEHLLISYTLKNITREYLTGNSDSGIMLEYDNETFFFLIYEEYAVEHLISKQLNQLCEKYIELCWEYFHFSPQCFPGKIIYPFQLPEMARYLIEVKRSIPPTAPRVIPFDQWQEMNKAAQTPDIKIIAAYFNTGRFNEIPAYYNDYFEKLKRRKIIVHWNLFIIKQDFMQQFYLFIYHKEVSISLLMEDAPIYELYRRADHDVSSFLCFTAALCSKLDTHIKLIHQPEDLVRTAISFIEAHLCDDINRDLIAQTICIHPDYLSRLFKKYTGHLISEYILMRRMELAKRLMLSSLTVSDIAVRTGYNSASYFSTVFKKYTGKSPAEYKKEQLSSGITLTLT